MKVDTTVVREVFFLKCCFEYVDQNGGRSHNTKIDSSSLERAEEFK